MAEAYTRAQLDISQLTHRIDDISLRVAVIENSAKLVDARFQDLRELIEVKLNNQQKAIDRWNQIGMGLLIAIGGTLLAAIVNWMLHGGLEKF